jgi:hypothetical protein
VIDVAGDDRRDRRVAVITGTGEWPRSGPPGTGWITRPVTIWPVLPVTMRPGAVLRGLAGPVGQAPGGDEAPAGLVVNLHRDLSHPRPGSSHHATSQHAPGASRTKRLGAPPRCSRRLEA